MSLFVKAERTLRPLKLAITGPSGSGKTYSALVLAKSISEDGGVAVIDTENNSASLYSDLFEFSVLNLRPPYEVRFFESAIIEAEKAGFKTIIIDSFSHVWAGQGGLLEVKNNMDASNPKGSFTNWKKINRLQDSLDNAIIHSKMNFIVTMRSKHGYIETSDETGRKKIQKVGLEPVQRDNQEYNWDIVFDLDQSHFFSCTKDRTGIFDGKSQVIDSSVGTKILDWQKSAKVGDTGHSTSSAMTIKPSPSIVSEMKRLGISQIEATQLAQEKFKVNLVRDLTPGQQVELIGHFEELAEAKKGAVNENKSSQ